MSHSVTYLSMLLIEKEKKKKRNINIDLAVVASQWSEVVVHNTLVAVIVRGAPRLLSSSVRQSGQ